MKKLKHFRRTAAWLLALAMVFTAAGTLADTDAYTENLGIYEGQVYPEDAPLEGSLEQGYVLNMDLVPDPSQDEGIAPALRVESSAPETAANINVLGDILQEEERKDYVNIVVLDVISGNQEGSATVFVDGDVAGVGTSTEDFATVTAIRAASGEDTHVYDGDYKFPDPEGNETSVYVEGKVIAQADAPGYEPDEGDWGPDDGENEVALQASSEFEGNTTTVMIGEGAEGSVELTALNGGTVVVQVLDGGIVTDDEPALNVINGNEYYDGEGEEETVQEIPGGTVEFAITGDTVSEGDVAVQITNQNGGDVTGTLDGAVKAPEGQAINIANTDDGTVDLTVTGPVQSEFDAENTEPQGDGMPAVNVQNENGDVHLALEGGMEVTNGPALHSINDGGSTDIQLSGSVTVENSVGPAVSLENRGGEQTLELENLETTQTETALNASAAGEDASTEILIEGSILNENTASEDPEEFAWSTGMDLQVGDGGRMTAKMVGDSVSARIEGEAENTQTTAVQLHNGGGDLDAVIGADVAAEGATRNVGLSVTSDGDMEYLVQEDEDGVADDGEFYSWDHAVIDGKEQDVYFHATDENMDQNYILGEDGEYHPVDGNMVYSEGSTKVTVVGDVKSENIGLELNVAKEQTAEVIVDGTVTAPEPVILYGDDTQVGQNVTLTVWEIVPDEADDPLVMRETYDESGACVWEEDKEAEKQIQYIIRVEQDQEDMITTEGTTNYDGYSVAHEGDRVTLKLTVPEGCEITGAFGDQSKQLALLKDSNGNYYIEVPRGGGVLLSLTYRQLPPAAPAEPEETETQAAPAAAAAAPAAVAWNYAAPKTEVITELLQVKDKEKGETVITFLSDGSYRVKYEDGTSELGTFSLVDGQIVLVNENDAEKTGMPITWNEETKVYEMTFTPSLERETPETFMFEFTDLQQEILVLNRLAA